jgi:CubicO group peptidase (beta-lactamase class C family)
MSIKLILSLLLAPVTMVFANDSIDLPFQTEFVNINESANLNAFENNLRPSYLIAGDESSQKASIYKVMQEFNIPGVSIAAIHNGRVAWLKSYGYKDNKNKLPLTTRDLLQAASISKSFAVLGLLRLATEQKLDLDANINNYLIGWKIPINKFTAESYVTARMLISHTAGINVHGFPGIPSSLSGQLPTIIDVLNGKKPYVETESVNVIQTPGTSMYYSGGGTSILQLAAQSITNQNFASWMQETVLLPLNMANSTYQQPLPSKYSNQFSSGHDVYGIPLLGKYHNYPELAAAGLWTTPKDLAQGLLALINAYYQESEVINLNPNLTKNLFIPQPNSKFGLGLELEHHGKVLVFGHAGDNDGFHAIMFAFVSDKPQVRNKRLMDGLVVMTNSDNGMLINQMLINSFNDTYKIGYNDPKIIEPTKLSKTISKYEVKFVLSDSDFLHSVIVKNNLLYLDWGQGAPLERLYQVDTDHFISLFGNKLNYSWANKQLKLEYQYFDSSALKVEIK